MKTIDQPLFDELPRQAFAPLKRKSGYLPLEDYGLIGDGATAALVGRDGTVAWLCLPHFDGPPLFCSLLDRRRGGSFTIQPQGLIASWQAYLSDSGVLVTEMRGASGVVRVVDLLTFREKSDLHQNTTAARGELLRQVQVLEGDVRVHIELTPHGKAQCQRSERGWSIASAGHPDLTIELEADPSLDSLSGEREMSRGERLDLLLRWRVGQDEQPRLAPDAALKSTLGAWQRWLECFDYRGPQRPLVRRSAITLKMLDYFENGAIVAAPTSSLPEEIGGVRNWDYRYVWIRDASFSVYALRRIGLTSEADSFLTWVLDVIDHEGRQPRVLYNLYGRQPEPEREDPHVEGYRRSTPVRWGNGAADQRQHDVYGELVDCTYQWATGGGKIDRTLWEHVVQYIDAAATEWGRDDHGIWEVRTRGHPYTYSAALCHVALDRGAKLAETLGLPGDIDRWRSEAERIRAAILNDGWNASRKSLTEHLDGGGLDASLLTLPLRRVLRADHPKMVATVDAIAERLGCGDGLVYRYLPDESPDGLTGGEGAFLLCSFWLVDNLAMQGRRHEALELYQSLCARANPLGLLPEQIDPASGEFLGNYPQAFSHVGLISSGVTLARLFGGDDQ